MQHAPQKELSLERPPRSLESTGGGGWGLETSPTHDQCMQVGVRGDEMHRIVHTLTHTHSHKLTHTFTHTHSHKLSHTHTLTHSHTHTLTHTLSRRWG